MDFCLNFLTGFTAICTYGRLFSDDTQSDDFIEQKRGIESSTKYSKSNFKGVGVHFRCQW